MDAEHEEQAGPAEEPDPSDEQSTEHRRLADDLDRQARDLQQGVDEVGGRVDEARGEWRRRQQDAGVPGAEPVDADDEEGAGPDLSEEEAEEPGGPA